MRFCIQGSQFASGHPGLFPHLTHPSASNSKLSTGCKHRQSATMLRQPGTKHRSSQKNHHCAQHKARALTHNTIHHRARCIAVAHSSSAGGGTEPSTSGARYCWLLLSLVVSPATHTSLYVLDTSSTLQEDQNKKSQMLLGRC